MKTHSHLFTLAALAVAASSAFGQTATTPPVGYRTETIKGNAFNLVSADLDNPVAVAGIIDAVAGTTLTDNDVDFTNPALGTGLILQITEGANQGFTAFVTGVTQHTVTTAQDISALITAGTTKYEIRKALTIADLFGATNSAGLQSGNQTTADKLWILDESGLFQQYYYADAAPPFITVGWRKVAGGNTDRAAVPVYFTDGIFIQRVAATDKDIVFTGHVRKIKSKVGIETGFNYLSRVLPVPMTLAQSGLETELQAGNQTTADKVWIPDGAGGYSQYYFATAQPPFITAGWRKVAGGNTDQSGVSITSAFIIERVGAATNATLAIPAGLDI